MYYLRAGAIVTAGMYTPIDKSSTYGFLTIISALGFWRLEDKIGMSLDEIHFHGNVPQCKLRNRFICCIFGPIVERLSTDPSYLQTLKSFKHLSTASSSVYPSTNSSNETTTSSKSSPTPHIPSNPSTPTSSAGQKRPSGTSKNSWAAQASGRSDSQDQMWRTMIRRTLLRVR